MGGCLLLFVSLGGYTIKLFFGWAAIGLVLYGLFGRRHSHLAPAAGGA
jgi:APA family basic amino acid/polyamine antiporter